MEFEWGAMGSRGIAIIPRPDGPEIATCLPTLRWGLVNRLRPRLTLPVEARGRNQLSLFLKALRHFWQPLELHLLDATLLFDGGQGHPTGYHNDLWFTAGLHNQVIQLWIPLVCEGPHRESARSMLRVDPRPLEDGWACPSGVGRLVNIWSGEERPLPPEAGNGILLDDLPFARGGTELETGQVLLFDNRYCHYTLPSRARRVALALRLCRGVPISNGYFSRPRPLDGRASSERNRESICRLLQGKRDGQSVSADDFLHRMDLAPAQRRLVTRLLMALLLADSRRELHPVLTSYVEAITAQLQRSGAG
jgi:hypothetical protein